MLTDLCGKQVKVKRSCISAYSVLGKRRIAAKVELVAPARAWLKEQRRVSASRTIT